MTTDMSSHPSDAAPSARRLRIGLVAPPWIPVPPPEYGGTESVIDRLARGLVDAGHEVLLFATGDSTCPVPRAWVVDGARSESMGAGVVELHHAMSAYEHMSHVDLVHDHTVLGPALAALSCPVPVVTTNHSPFDRERKAIYRRLCGHVDIVAISHDQAATADDIRISAVIHHGLDVDEFPLGGGEGGYLLFLGRMDATKGVREAALIAREAELPLVIAAKMRAPEEHEFFEAEVRPLLGGGVEYIGEVAGAEKLRLLRDARALLNPIRWHEPFGLVMIEALACGTPVLARPEGAAPEIVDHGVTGFLGRDRADLVRYAHRVDELDRAACRVAVEARFSTERMVADHVELYRRVLAERGSGVVAARRPLTAVERHPLGAAS